MRTTEPLRPTNPLATASRAGYTARRPASWTCVRKLSLRSSLAVWLLASALLWLAVVVVIAMV